MPKIILINIRCYIIIMSNKKAKANHQNHDDCDDCRRQRKQNAELIAIYEKLQSINSKSKTMRNSVDLHRSQCNKTKQKFMEFSHRFSSLPKESKASVELERVGHQMAKEMLEKSLRGTTKKQNERLQNILKKMHRNRNSEQKHHQIMAANNSYCHQPTEKPKIDYRNNSYAPFNIYSKQLGLDLPRKTSSIRYIEQISEEDASDTKTTGFLSTNNRKNFNETGKLDNLNLWLYDSDLNKSLEQGLYETRMPRMRISQKKNRQKALPELTHFSRKF